MIADGIYEEVVDDSYTISAGLVASSAPLYPPSAWYEDPGLTRPTPLSITADGRISGHIAAWETNHIGLPPGTRPPHSRSGYSFFKTGIVKTDDGKEIPVGQLTLAGGHAPISASAREAVEHYDDTASAVADVTVGEDAHGIWVSGGLRPGVTDEQIRVLRASAPSGDWRPINGALELVAVCQVNTPGFPIAQAMVASGEITALVAAGAVRMYELQQENQVLSSLDSVLTRIENLESVVAAAARSNAAESEGKERTSCKISLKDIGVGDLANNTQGINEGIGLDGKPLSEMGNILKGTSDDSVEVDVETKGKIKRSVPKDDSFGKGYSVDSELDGIIGGDSDNVDADYVAGLAEQEKARNSAEKHAENVEGNGILDAKRVRLQTRMKRFKN